MSFDERDYARKRAEQRAQSSWYKLKEGDNTFRILPVPHTDTVKTNFYEYSVHREVGPKKTTVRCGVDPVSGEGECWICDRLIPSLKKKKMDQRATALAPRGILLMQVAKVDDDGKMTGPFLFTPAKTVGDQLLGSIFASRKRSYVDPVKGYNISISRTGSGRLDTKYGMIEPDPDPSPVSKSMIDKVKPFEELKEIPVYSEAKQQAAYHGREVETEEEEQQEEERPRRRSTTVEEEDDVDLNTAEDVAEDDDEDLEEDEPTPKPKAKAGKKHDVEDDDEDLEEDEPTPKAKAGKKSAPVEDDDEDLPDEIDLDSLDDEDEEEPAPKPKTSASSGVKPKPKARR